VSLHTVSSYKQGPICAFLFCKNNDFSINVYRKSLCIRSQLFLSAIS